MGFQVAFSIAEWINSMEIWYQKLIQEKKKNLWEDILKDDPNKYIIIDVNLKELISIKFSETLIQE